MSVHHWTGKTMQELLNCPLLASPKITASNTKMYLWSVSHDIWTIWWYIVFIVWPFTQLGMCNTDRVWICSSHFSRHDNRTTQILHVHSIILPTYAFNGSNCRHRSPIKYPHYPTSNLHYIQWCRCSIWLHGVVLFCTRLNICFLNLILNSIEALANCLIVWF